MSALRSIELNLRYKKVIHERKTKKLGNKTVWPSYVVAEISIQDLQNSGEVWIKDSQNV